MKTELDLIPEYPRTRHLPHKANAKNDDLVCTLEECKQIWTHVTAVQEKVDGSQCRMTILDGHPLIGNRNHILNKSYSKDKIRTASKMQFSSIFGWWYVHKSCFEKLQEQGSYSVYGDWMYMQHGMHYDKLPSLFITYDIYDFNKKKFIDPKIATDILQSCGFSVTPLCHYDTIENFKQLEEMANRTSQFSEDKVEGVYLKVTDGEYVINRFKMVREGFEQGKYLSQKEMLKNKVKK